MSRAKNFKSISQIKEALENDELQLMLDKSGRVYAKGMMLEDYINHPESMRERSGFSNSDTPVMIVTVDRFIKMRSAEYQLHKRNGQG